MGAVLQSGHHYLHTNTEFSTGQMSFKSHLYLQWFLLNFRLQLKGSVKELNKFHIYETEKITRKASDTAEYIELFGSFTRDRYARHI